MLRDRYSTDVKNHTIFDDAQCSPDFFVIIIRVGAHHDDVLLLQLDYCYYSIGLLFIILYHVETLRLFRHNVYGKKIRSTSKPTICDNTHATRVSQFFDTITYKKERSTKRQGSTCGDNKQRLSRPYSSNKTSIKKKESYIKGSNATRRLKENAER